MNTKKKSLGLWSVFLHLVLETLQSSNRRHQAMLYNLLPLQASTAVWHLLSLHSDLLLATSPLMIFRLILVDFALQLDHLNLKIFDF